MHLSDLHAAYDGPVSPAELAAAKYGPLALERISVAGDANWLAGTIRAYGVCLRHAVRHGDLEAKARILLHCRDAVHRWRRYRDRLRALHKEIAALQRDMAQGLFKQAAE